eukprot:1845594-Rhodomonas_salina.2
MGRHSDRERGAGGRERVRERNKEEGGRKVGMGVVMGTDYRNCIGDKGAEALGDAIATRKVPALRTLALVSSKTACPEDENENGGENKDEDCTRMRVRVTRRVRRSLRVEIVRKRRLGAMTRGGRYHIHAHPVRTFKPSRLAVRLLVPTCNTCMLPLVVTAIVTREARY